MEAVQKALRDHSGELMSIPGVVGTGEGLCGGRPCIKVFVVKKTPELSGKIPPEIEGCPVEIVETGEIKPVS